MTIKGKAKATWRHNSQSIGTQEKRNCEKIGNSSWRPFQDKKASVGSHESQTQSIH